MTLLAAGFLVPLEQFPGFDLEDITQGFELLRRQAPEGPTLLADPVDDRHGEAALGLLGEGVGGQSAVGQELGESEAHDPTYRLFPLLTTFHTCSIFSGQGITHSEEIAT